MKIVSATIFFVICSNIPAYSEEKKLLPGEIDVTHWMPTETCEVFYTSLKRIAENKDLKVLLEKYQALIPMELGISIENAHSLLKAKSSGDVGHVTIIQGDKAINAESCKKQQPKEVKYGFFMYYQLKNDAGFAHFPADGTVVLAVNENTMQQLLDNPNKSTISDVVKAGLAHALPFDIFELSTGLSAKRFLDPKANEFSLTTSLKGTLIGDKICMMVRISTFDSEDDAKEMLSAAEKGLEQVLQPAKEMLADSKISELERKQIQQFLEAANVTSSNKTITTRMFMPVKALLYP
ncbi:MAG: hypothetical protein R3B84_12830 [Zavarzinella sp.]